MRKFKNISLILLGTLIFSMNGCKKRIQIPSYLKGYEEAYAENPRDATLQ